MSDYDYKGKKRPNNPPVGLVDSKSDGGEGKSTYAFDPHLNSTLVLVFFPMAAEKEGWSKLAKNLKAGIDEIFIEAYRGIVSLPLALGKHGRVAVKIVDDRVIESLKI